MLSGTLTDYQNNHQQGESWQSMLGRLLDSSSNEIYVFRADELEGTPCENVVGKALCCYPDRIQERFPRDLFLSERGVESYVGTPLFDNQHRPFHTSKPDGLGLGLTISRSIVESYGGHLWADANATEGAKFQFTLPISS
jgi:hypothetical protein